MKIKTYDELVIEMCDAFDAFIAPKQITRSNENFLYLLLKAIAKGYERIITLVAGVNNKFNPLSCSDEDLESIAFLVGTERKKGKSSGLQIIATNNTGEAATLPAGEYRFERDAESVFTFLVLQDIPFPDNASFEFLAFSTVQGIVEVDDIGDIDVKRVDEQLFPDFDFECFNNNRLVGYPDESNLNFRQRILTTSDRQDAIKELEMEIGNLPYILDVTARFNEGASPVTVGGISVPPKHLLLTLNGDPREEVADVVCRHTIYPTVEVDSSDYVSFFSPILLGGEYKVFFNRFTYTNYDLEITYRYNSRLVKDEIIELEIEKLLLPFRFEARYKPFLTEREFYESVGSVSLPSFSLLDIKLKQGGNEVTYLDSNPVEILRLDNVSFISEDRQ